MLPDADVQNWEDKDKETSNNNGEYIPQAVRPKRERKVPKLPMPPTARRRANERWFYEPVLGPDTAEVKQAVVKSVSNDLKVGDKDDLELFETKMDDKGDSSLSKEKVLENCQIFYLSDQSKWNFTVEKEKNNVSERTDEKLPVYNDNRQKSVEELFGKANSTGKTSCMILDSLGPMESLPKYLEHAEDNEERAWDLQGLIFHDE
jgi:hypothetical protein